MTCPICRLGAAPDCGVCGFRARQLEDGLFESGADVTKVEYPRTGNDEMAAVEETSYWFAHRNSIIAAAVTLYPWQAPLLDIGGGNGFQARLLSSLGEGVVMVEPGAAGCVNAITRSVSPVVRATLESLHLKDGSVGGIALFDVLEHLAPRGALLGEASRIIRRGGRLYITVPSLRWLWSYEDVRAEHKLRYTAASLREELTKQGYEIEYLTYFFLPLVPPIFALRSLPTLLGFHGTDHATGREHSADGFLGRALRSHLRLEVGWLPGERRAAVGVITAVCCPEAIAAIATAGGTNHMLQLHLCRPDQRFASGVYSSSCWTLESSLAPTCSPSCFALIFGWIQSI